MEWKSPAHKEQNTYAIPERWVYLHYYEAFNLLFRVENALRLLVYVVLKREYGAKWDRVSITSEEGDTTVGAAASKRKSQASTFGYLGYPVTSPLMYLTTGELFRIITADAYWKLFKPFFPGAKKVSEMKFDEISSVRNDLAHFRPLKLDDVETVKQSSKHILTSVENQLYQMMSCPDTVPTNTTEEWYQALSALGTDLCRLHFKQSNSEEWLRIDLVFKPPIVEHRSFGSRFHGYTFLTTDGPSILRAHKDLAELIIYCSESSRGDRVGLDGKANPTKTLSFGFARETVKAHQNRIRSALETILSSVTNETELIEQDNLARGKYTRTASLSVAIEEEKDSAFLDGSPLNSGYREDDPPEWWGDVDVYAADVISALHTYPWMPTQVSPMSFF